MKYLRDCDLIIYDLHSGNPRDVELALEALKKKKKGEEEEEKEKVLILISSLMAWSGTPRKIGAIAEADPTKPDTPEEEEPEEVPKEEPEEPQSEMDEGSKEGEEVKSKENVPVVDDKADEALENFLPKKVRSRPNYVPFTEDDYEMRTPSAEYQIIKEIEDKVLNFNEMLKQEMLAAKKEAGLDLDENAEDGAEGEEAEFKSGVKTYVVSAGILYGKGEAIFNSHLRQAWKQEPARLPYVGDGDNLVPSIHVTDLARIVKAIYEKKPDKKYIFAVDNNKRPMQKKLVAAISNGIGTGLIESVDVPQEFKHAHSKSTPI